MIIFILFYIYVLYIPLYATNVERQWLQHAPAWLIDESIHASGRIQVVTNLSALHQRIKGRILLDLCTSAQCHPCGYGSTQAGSFGYIGWAWMDFVNLCHPLSSFVPKECVTLKWYLLTTRWPVFTDVRCMSIYVAADAAVLRGHKVKSSRITYYL